MNAASLHSVTKHPREYQIQWRDRLITARVRAGLDARSFRVRLACGDEDSFGAAIIHRIWHS
ncbi:hypothetical protein FB009_103312 [Sinorhizobium medicae]|nr:hypothetical protein FB009_103312 [Sinorhizobium medicae]TWA53988.1 hypothetical protein FB008_10478 [Sinorhizobium medicae]